MDPTSSLAAARAFGEEADAIYLLYRDALAALREYRAARAPLPPDTYLEYRSGDHAVAPSTVGELLDRTAPGGPDENLLANLALVTLYGIWEHRRREEIATALALTAADIQIPSLGDLRLFRNAIVHPLGKALTELDKCELMRWFGPGDQVRFTSAQIEEVVGRVRSGVTSFVLAKVKNAT